MSALAALALAGAVPPLLVRAEAALDHAWRARLAAEASMCGDQGRRAELMRLESSHAQLAKVFEARSGHAADAVLVLDTISGCARWGSYRPSVIEARLALAEAHAALGLGE